MRISNLRQLPLVLLVSGLVIGTSAMAAKGGNGGGGGKPGDGGGSGGGGGGTNCVPGARFPALIYPENGISVASSDGCVQLVVEPDVSLPSPRLEYDTNAGTGFYAWLDLNTAAIMRQHFSVTGESLEKQGDVEIIFQGSDVVWGYDIQDETLAVVLRNGGRDTGENRLVLVDLTTCASGFPCQESDAVPVYAPSAGCLEDAAVVGCFLPGTSSPALSPDGTSVYFDVRTDDYIYGIARGSVVSGDWVSQSAEMYLRDDYYDEAGVHGLSADGRYLAIGYLAGFDKRVRDERVIIFDTTVAPLEEASGYIQNFPAWSAAWTEENTFFLVGSLMQKGNLDHPIEAFDPVSGTRESIGIVLGAHPPIDSSL